MTNPAPTTPAPAGKKFWESKIFWVNVISLAAILIQSKTGFVVSPEMQAGALAAINTTLGIIAHEHIS